MDFFISLLLEGVLHLIYWLIRLLIRLICFLGQCILAVCVETKNLILKPTKPAGRVVIWAKDGSKQRLP